MPMEASGNLEQEFNEALEKFIEKAKRNKDIIAGLLYGSLVNGDIWEKSDIDIILISNDPKTDEKFYILSENGIDISVTLFSRNYFKKLMEGPKRISIFDSILVSCKLCFTKDPTLTDYINEIGYIGERDRELSLMNYGSELLLLLGKAEKWLYCKGDAEYSSLYLTYGLQALARIEVLLAKQVAHREALHMALEMNNEFFRVVYTDFINNKKDKATLHSIFVQINDYLFERADVIFRPILDFLAKKKEACTISEMLRYFETITITNIFALEKACSWLAEKGLIEEHIIPVRITTKGEAEMGEIAYYYDRR